MIIKLTKILIRGNGKYQKYDECHHGAKYQEKLNYHGANLNHIYFILSLSMYSKHTYHLRKTTSKICGENSRPAAPPRKIFFGPPNLKILPTSLKNTREKSHQFSNTEITSNKEQQNMN